ncbi:uncharacterized protein LOC120439971 [Oreochromis aureus]|uniref:HECT domain-containing protein n=1 Tax=Oreochromis aureus TaxID=47969 RepID=A0AAZ1XUH3_OREAU|nr:uncharacterized protein LOC120439971 [Oreochromis aureus]
MRELFRPANTRVASTSQVATRSSTGVRQSLRYQTQKHFGNWNCRSRKSLEFLMACGNRLIAPKLRAGQELDANLIHKIYKSKALYIRPPKPILDDITSYSSEENCEENPVSSRQLRSSSSDSFASSTAAFQPISAPTQSPASSVGNGTLLMETPALTHESSISHKYSSASTNISFSQLPVSSLEIYPSTSQPSTSSSASLSDPVLVLTCQNTSSSPYQTRNPENHCSALPSTSTHSQSVNYDNYLSIMTPLSDMSSDDEELNQAILASLQSERNSSCLVSAKDILEELSAKINQQKKCKFNINRSTVLDGAIRGFKRATYDPCHTISVRFSDDMGVPEEAVDLGGPRREFLRLLIEALPLSPMFEGEEGKMNLALDSAAMREDRYFIAGRAIAVSLVHGGPPAGFLSPTLFSCLVDGPDLAKPVLEDVADSDLREKIKRVKECKSFEDLIVAT